MQEVQLLLSGVASNQQDSKEYSNTKAVNLRVIFLRVSGGIHIDDGAKSIRFRPCCIFSRRGFNVSYWEESVLLWIRGMVYGPVNRFGIDFEHDGHTVFSPIPFI